MSQRNVENFIGRLATDRDLRDAFTTSPSEALLWYRNEGHELAAVEAAALVHLDIQALCGLAETLDPKLCRLSSTANSGTYPVVRRS